MKSILLGVALVFALCAGSVRAIPNRSSSLAYPKVYPVRLARLESQHRDVLALQGFRDVVAAQGDPRKIF